MRFWTTPLLASLPSSGSHFHPSSDVARGRCLARDAMRWMMRVSSSLPLDASPLLPQRRMMHLHSRWHQRHQHQRAQMRPRGGGEGRSFHCRAGSTANSAAESISSTGSSPTISPRRPKYTAPSVSRAPGDNDGTGSAGASSHSASPSPSPSPSQQPLPPHFMVDNSATAIRRDFIKFFVDRNHGFVPSSSLIPKNDPSLLFTNAGMVQFKDRFLYPDMHKSASFASCVSVQKCVRAGGKHNDLENVGYTPRHHTFFEMLGNFSFGGYFKEQAIRLAWDYLVTHLGLPKERLLITVYKDDTESFDIWNKQIGVPKSKIWLLGAADNFWSMGAGSGPCGPCTEIHFDLQNGLEESNPERYMEIWNVVFMEESFAEGRGEAERLPLTTPCIDTGMGLERLASVLQNKTNNFETDLFVPITRAVSEMVTDKSVPVPKEYLNIIADHIRSVSFLIADGVLPSNVGRGYVLRRIIRRAAGVGFQLRLPTSFLVDLLPSFLSTVDEAFYPDVFSRQEQIRSIIRQEAALFSTTLENGQSLLQTAIAKCKSTSDTQLPASLVFSLYDTHGFPFDLTRIVAKQHGLDFDESKVDELMEKQRALSRKSFDAADGIGASLLLENLHPADCRAWKEALLSWKAAKLASTFVGYTDSLVLEPSQVLGVCSAEHSYAKLLVVDRTPMYAESGGQVGDVGVVLASDGSQRKCGVVKNTIRPANAQFTCHLVAPVDESVASLELFDSISAGSSVVLAYNVESRTRAAIHHTSVHLLNGALRKMFGPGVIQAGSLVTPQRLRFDFTHGAPLTRQQLASLEQAVNEIAQANAAVETTTTAYADAVKDGALFMMEESYGDSVRVVRVGDFSKELCGGTHAKSALMVFPFKIISESSVAAGTRRIEAVAGPAAKEWMDAQLGTLQRITENLGASAANVLESSESLPKSLKEQRKAIQALYHRLALSLPLRPLHRKTGDGAPLEAPSGLYPMDPSVPVMVHVVPGTESDEFVEARAAALTERLAPGAVHLVAHGSKLLCFLNASQFKGNKVHAGTVWKQANQGLGNCGKGGGGPSQARGVVSAEGWDEHRLGRALVEWLHPLK